VTSLLYPSSDLAAAEAFLDATERLAQRRPMSTLATTDICHEAQRSTHHFYASFCYPELLWLALDLRGLDVLHRLTASATAGVTSGLEQVVAICRARVQAGCHFPLYHQAAGLVMGVDPQLLQAHRHLPLVTTHQNAKAVALETLGVAVQAGQVDGRIGLKADAQIVAHVLISQCRGVVEHCLNQDETETTPHDFLAVWTASLYNMLAVDPDSGVHQ
jgi:hypothetical protein